MENCLVTKLMGEFDNKNLPMFDSVPLYFTNKTPKAVGSGYTIGVTSGKVRLVSVGYDTFYNSNALTTALGKDIEVANGTTVYTDRNTGSTKYWEHGYIIGASKLTSLKPKGYNFFMLDGLHDCVNLTEIVVTGPDAAAECQEIENFSDKQNLSHLGNCISLQTVFFNYAYLYGDIDALAASQVANGRTSGTLTLSGLDHSGKAGKGTITCSITYTAAVRITFDSSLPNGYSLTADPS